MKRLRIGGRGPTKQPSLFSLDVASKPRTVPATATAHMLHPGKTGGTAVKTALYPWREAGPYELLLYRGHQHRLVDIPEGDVFFFFVRDPIERAVSAFYSRQRQGRPRHDTPWNPPEAAAFAIFDTVRSLADALGAEPGSPERTSAVAAMRGISHMNTSYWDWFGTEDELRKRAGDLLFVGHQERLDDDFQHLTQLLGLPEAALPSDDVGAHRTPATADRSLSASGRESLREWYAADYRFLEVCAELEKTSG